MRQVQIAGSEGSTETRGNILTLLRNISTTVAPTASSVSVTLAMLSLVVSDPRDVSDQTQLDSLDLFVSTLDAGKSFGSLSSVDGANMLNIVSTVLEASQLTRNSSTTEGRTLLASSLITSLDVLSLRMATGLVVGQDAIVLVAGEVELQAQMYNDLTAIDIPSVSSSSRFSLGSTGSVAEGTTVCSSMSQCKNNIFEGEIYSELLTLTLFDCVTGVEIQYSEGEVLIELKHLSDSNEEPTECSYWDEDSGDWSTDGCTVMTPLSSSSGAEGVTRCSCTHLTSFAATIAPPLDIPYINFLTWANVRAHPEMFYFLVILTSFFVLMSWIGYLIDNTKDSDAIAAIYKLLQKESIGDHDGIAEEFGLIKKTGYLSRALLKAYRSHSWVSVFGRHPCDNVSSIDRTWITYCGLVCAATSTVIFTAQSDDPRSAEVIFVLGSIYGSLVSFIIGSIITKCFPSGTTRFDQLFMDVCEDICVANGYPKDGNFHDLMRNRLDVASDHLSETYKFSGAKLFLAQAVVADQYEGAYTLSTPEFNKSKVLGLRQYGYAFVATLQPKVTLKMLETRWQEGGYVYNDRKKLGYAFIFVISAFCWILLSAYMLELLIGKSGDMLPVYYKTLGLSQVYDVFIIQPITLFLYYFIVVGLQRFIFPENISFDYHYIRSLEDYIREKSGYTREVQTVNMDGRQTTDIFQLNLRKKRRQSLAKILKKKGRRGSQVLPETALRSSQIVPLVEMADFDSRSRSTDSRSFGSTNDHLDVTLDLKSFRSDSPGQDDSQPSSLRRRPSSSIQILVRIPGG